MKWICFLSGCIIFFLFTPADVKAQCCDFTYQQQIEPPTSAATFGVALGDFDGDNDQDAVAISAYYGIDVYFNNGSGTFTLNAQYATGTNGDFYGVYVCDVDSDNDQDIIAMPFYASAGLTILFNNGSGVFTGYNISSNISTYNGAVGDIDGDNDKDVFLPNAGGGSGKIYKNSGIGLFSLHQTLSGARGHDADLGDLDNDGDLDAFVVENSSYGNAIFLNDSTGTFTQSGSTFSSNCTFVDLGDLDKDGDLDAWVGKSGNSCEIWLNNGTGTFTLDTTITTGSYCKSVNLFDLDNDGDLDVFLGFYSSAPQVWKNGGDMTFTLCYQAPVGSSSHGQTIGYINNDNNIDIYSGYFSNDDGDFVFLNASPAIHYPNNPFCHNLSTPQNITLAGTSGGSYGTIPYGLSLDYLTGTVIPSASLPGNYTVTYTIAGCTVTTPVRVKDLDTTVTLVDSTLTANQDSATYQWVDCNNGFAQIQGATGQSYAPVVTGNYAVIITYDGCTDTSGCVEVTLFNGIESPVKTSTAGLFPNPATGLTVLKTSSNWLGASWKVLDQAGRILLSGKIVNQETLLDFGNLTPGFYILRIEEKDTLNLKFIRQ